MKALLLILLTVHGLIHLLGFVKAFGLAPVDQLVSPISRGAGILWLAAGVSFTGAAVLHLLRVPAWGCAGAVGLILSQGLIILSWSDAKFGTIANVLLFLPILAGCMGALPTSYINRFTADAQQRLAAAPDTSILTDRDIAHLPPPVQRYLHFTGSVGRPKVANFRAAMSGTMRRSLSSEWSPIEAQQYSFFHEPARLFYIESSLFGIPFDGYHAYLGDHATMQIKVGSLFEVVDARGPRMDQGETVTMFNDMCLLAPATLIAPTISWELIDPLTVRGTFVNAGNTVSAVITFDPSGAITNFVSHDRFLSEDGKTYLNYPWSTPVAGYREFDGRKIAATGEAVWHTPGGEFPYGRFTTTEMEYNIVERR